ncbi:Phage endolysin [Collimonas arenae]|uniref:Phage endolysin n=1 Tax=Collimonas arenae TaxID=279058 RepID=A0A0A1FJA8_9BURK|nr:Rz-like lysis system protein LysB [Collimonas arenae]AIY42987.1 Phage endolysin [Collimonas arenae]
MAVIVKSLIAALLATALGAVIYIQRDALNAARERVKRAEQTVRDQDSTIKTLTDTAAKTRRAAAKLQATNDHIAATLTERENLIESLQHDNATIRSWADTPLPDAIARLRERPAATGAYHQRLPDNQPVQSAGDGA